MLMDDVRAASMAGAIETFPFSYSANFPIAVLVVGAVLPVPIGIDNDSDFVVRQSMYSAWTAAGVLAPAPDLLVQFFDNASGRNWQNQPQHVMNVLGTGQLPFLWPEAALVKGGATLTVTISNIDAVAMLVRVTLSGVKIYSKSGYWRA